MSSRIGALQRQPIDSGVATMQWHIQRLRAHVDVHCVARRMLGAASAIFTFRSLKRSLFPVVVVSSEF